VTELKVLNKKALEVKTNNIYFAENRNTYYCDTYVGPLPGTEGGPGGVGVAHGW